MIKNLKKIIDNEYLDSYSIYELKTNGLIMKITFNQYVITSKGFELLNQN